MLEVLSLGHSTLTDTAAITTIVAFLGGLTAVVYRVARRIERSLGVDSKGRTVSERLDRVEHQLWPNGGTSLADAVHRTANSLAETRVEVRVTRDLMTKILETRVK